MLNQIVKFVRLDQRLDKTVVTLVFYVTLALVFYTWCSRFYGGVDRVFSDSLFGGVDDIVEATLVFIFQVIIFRVIAEAFMRITDIAERYELRPKSAAKPVDTPQPDSSTEETSPKATDDVLTASGNLNAD